MPNPFWYDKRKGWCLTADAPSSGNLHHGGKFASRVYLWQFASWHWADRPTAYYKCTAHSNSVINERSLYKRRDTEPLYECQFLLILIIPAKQFHRIWLRQLTNRNRNWCSHIIALLLTIMVTSNIGIPFALSCNLQFAAEKIANCFFMSSPSLPCMHSSSFTYPLISWRVNQGVDLLFPPDAGILWWYVR